ncbi:SAM-dependent methyltransferase, putative [Citrifermentans bemidjiense Bem]|uniref:SAM-dependent methyltransferase, putative n=1 Tax=Citrifermentans bemidjiense (strain ATCC BAA-1014 / DSM 16622 / JCM 12645 / Bem) TaxID=404380 RepID=B5EFB6_CITBB|nr:methyltransferase [Citrifermentans bemidjiense]ACH40871.1 SAM-dependent methyltransferase, putative [Citrifermentans bemidjiense Bem]
MPESVRRHYELYPYPDYPLLASVRRCDTYANNLDALWARFNGELPPDRLRRILIAGCGSFAPYPFALANPDSAITALDLSQKSLRRARLHCLLHGITHPEFVAGDLLDPLAAPGPFGFIDCYGVLHHLEDPLAGLTALEKRLGEGGILRVMVYSTYTRFEEDSIRRALRLLKVRSPEQVRQMVARARKGSRLREFFEQSQEVSSRSGLADALLHPLATSFKIDRFLGLVGESGLKPLIFAHRGALSDPGAEAARIRELEARRESPGNFVLYLGKDAKGGCGEGGSFRLNPCLAGELSRPHLTPLLIPGRLGEANPPIPRGERSFLRRFKKPVAATALLSEDLTRAKQYADKLFLLRCRS